MLGLPELLCQQHHDAAVLSAYLYSPVKNCLMFSAVLGATSAKSSMRTLPAGWPPMLTSAAAHSLGMLHTDCGHLPTARQQCQTPHQKRLQDCWGWAASCATPQLPSAVPIPAPD